MNKLLQYLIAFFKASDQGALPSYPDPIEPDGLGGALTQDDIDFVKRLRQEMTVRFPPPNDDEVDV